MEFDAACDGWMQAQPGYVEPISREYYEAMKANAPRRVLADGTPVH